MANFTSLETRMIVLPEAENRTIVSSLFWTKHWNVRKERQTDGRTDRQNLSSYYSGLHWEQCGKNGESPIVYREVTCRKICSTVTFQFHHNTTKLSKYSNLFKWFL